MKTLVFYGSARKNGHTKKMLDYLLEQLGDSPEEVTVIDAYRSGIGPCIDCRYCWKKRGCSVKDPMQEVYPLIDEADRIILAAPMYFFSIPGPLKSVVDRCQVYWASRVRGDRPEEYQKIGAALFVGGAPAFDDQFDAGEILAKHWLNDLRARNVGMVTFPDSDQDSIAENAEIRAQLDKLALELKNARPVE